MEQQTTKQDLGISVYLHNVLGYAYYTRAAELVRNHIKDLEGNLVIKNPGKKGYRLIPGKEQEFDDWLRSKNPEFVFKQSTNQEESDNDEPFWYSRMGMVNKLGYEITGDITAFIGELVDKNIIPRRFVRLTPRYYKISSEALAIVEKHLSKKYSKKKSLSTDPDFLVVKKEPDKRTLPGLSLDKLLEMIGAKPEALEIITRSIEEKDLRILPYFLRRNGEYTLINGTDLVLTQASREVISRIKKLGLLKS